jgi:hypothetical protein
MAERPFGIKHAVSILAKNAEQKKPTPTLMLGDIQKDCVDHGHAWRALELYDLPHERYRKI